MSKDIVVKKDWITKAGYRAVILLVRGGSHHCGYVGIPKGHPLHGIDYDDKAPWQDQSEDSFDSAGSLVDVHGGVTYSKSTSPENYPAADTEDLYWWGFDCAHAGDETRYMLNGVTKGTYGVFRDVDYCVEQCEKMAEQLKAIEVDRRMAVSEDSGVSIVIHVDGGCVQGVFCSDPDAVVTLIDEDNMKAEDMDGDQRYKALSDAIDGLTEIF